MHLVYHNAFGKTLYTTRTQYQFDTDPTYPPPLDMLGTAPSQCEHYSPAILNTSVNLIYYTP